MLNVRAKGFDEREFLPVTVTIVDCLAISAIPRGAVIFSPGAGERKALFFLAEITYHRGWPRQTSPDL
jgi:hypothetical protein